MRTSARTRYTGYRFPAEIIGHAVWLYFRFSLRMVEDLLAARGIIVSHETVRQWARKFGQQFANQIRRRAGLNVFWIRMSGVAEYQRSHLIEREPFLCRLAVPVFRRFPPHSEMDTPSGRQ